MVKTVIVKLGNFADDDGSNFNKNELLINRHFSMIKICYSTYYCFIRIHRVHKMVKTVLPAWAVTVIADVQRVSGSRAIVASAWISTSVSTHLVTPTLTASTRQAAISACAPMDRSTTLSTVPYRVVTADRRHLRYDISRQYDFHVHNCKV